MIVSARPAATKAAFDWCMIGIMAYGALGLWWDVSAIQGAAILAAQTTLFAVAYSVTLDATRRCVASLGFWIAFACLFFAVATPAKAQNAPTFRSPCWDCRDVAWRWDYRHHRHRRHDGDGDRCKSRLAIVGDQYASEKGAREEADKAWMQTARWQHGERYMARDHARDAAYECGRSSVGSVAGQVFYRCRLVARPCRAPSRGDER